MKRRSRLGFTLLEVLLATAIMAVGTTSVLVVIATAAGMASQRQVNVRREQVMDEARHDAQAMVDAFRPNAPTPLAAPVPGPKKSGGKAAEAPSATAPAKVEGKVSSRFGGFVYDISFEPKDRLVLEKGFDVTITVHYGGGELFATTTTSLISNVIPDEEFTSSVTYKEEKLGISNRDKPKETK